MKCISCETEINPKWRHAIDINVCPFCGKNIMEEHLKNLLSSLAVTMESLQPYQDQLDDWLLSNHNYIKTDSPNLKLFLPKDVIKDLRREIDDEEFQEKKRSIIKIKTPDGGEQEVVIEKTQSDEKTNGFFERAEVFKPSHREKGQEPDAPKSVAEKTQHLKRMAQQIKSEGSKGIIDETGLASMISPDMMSEADPETVAEYQSIISGGDVVSSGLMETPDGDEEKIDPRVLNMARLAQNKKGAVNKDLDTLREMQERVKNSHKKLSSGSGGFSRS